MPLFALTLSPEASDSLLVFVKCVVIVFAFFSFFGVAIYTAIQIRHGRLFTRESVPLPISMPSRDGWALIACVVALIYLQWVFYAVIVLISILRVVKENHSTVRVQFGFNRIPPVKAMVWGLVIFGAIMLVETPLMQASGWLLDSLAVPHPEQQSVETFRQYSSPFAIFGFLFMAVFVFPVIEELFFRGFLLTFLKNYTSTSLAVILSAGVFAFAHINLGAAIPLWFLGIVLGLAYEHTGSLLVPISIHACFNLATALSLLLDKGSPT